LGLTSETSRQTANVRKRIFDFALYDSRSGPYEKNILTKFPRK